jgi:hypothetical protein
MIGRYEAVSPEAGRGLSLGAQPEDRRAGDHDPDPGGAA